MVFNDGNARRIKPIRIPKMKAHVGSATQFVDISVNAKGYGKADVTMKKINGTIPLGSKDNTLRQYIKRPNVEKATQNNLAKFKSAHAETINNANAARKALKKEAGEGLLKWLGDNKIPQIAAGIGITAFLVNKLSDRRGQQSNAELYGQTPLR